MFYSIKGIRQCIKNLTENEKNVASDNAANGLRIGSTEGRLETIVAIVTQHRITSRPY